MPRSPFFRYLFCHGEFVAWLVVLLLAEERLLVDILIVHHVGVVPLIGAAPPSGTFSGRYVVI